MSAEHQHTGCVGAKRARGLTLSADHTGTWRRIVVGPARRLVDHDNTVRAGAIVFVPIPSLLAAPGRDRHRWVLGLLMQDLLDARRRPQRRVERSSSARRSCVPSLTAAQSPRYSSNASSISIAVSVEVEVDHRLVEITVDVDTRERHEFESFILDVLEFGARPDGSTRLLWLRGAGSVVPGGPCSSAVEVFEGALVRAPRRSR